MILYAETSPTSSVQYREGVVWILVPGVCLGDRAGHVVLGEVTEGEAPLQGGAQAEEPLPVPQAHVLTAVGVGHDPWTKALVGTVQALEMRGTPGEVPQKHSPSTQHFSLQFVYHSTLEVFLLDVSILEVLSELGCDLKNKYI